MSTPGKSTTEELNASFREIMNLKAALDEHSIVAVTDPRGRITYANEKFCTISKYSRAELLGQDHRIINSGHHPKDYIRNLWETIEQGRVWKGEFCNRAKDGVLYWVDTTIVPFLNAEGKPYQYVSIRTDITDRKKAEQETRKFNEELALRVRERTAEMEASNRELEAFSYSISHDLRAPLRHINGFIGLLRKSAVWAHFGESARHLQAIASSAEEMARLIDSLLHFSRMGRQGLRKSAVNIGALVNEVLASLQPEIGQRNVIWKKDEFPTVEGDASLLRQVFVNLLSNAVKYSRSSDPAVIEIGYRREKENEIVFFVRDNGVGFDMAYEDKLFGVFQRLHRADEFEGVGIGLANVRRIISRHGGRTWAEGAVGRGATFYFSLPVPTVQ